MSRLPLKAPDEHSPEQQAIARKCHSLVEKVFGPNGETFQYLDSRGGLMGPFPFVLYDARTSQAFMDLLIAMGGLPFPADARDTTILAIGTKYQAAYELYSHGATAVKTGALTQEQVDAIQRSEKPSDLNEECSIAYDAVSCLLNTPGPLPQCHWDKLVATFGKDGTVAWVHHVGWYCCVSMILNAIDAPIPD